MVAKRLEEMAEAGQYSGKFSSQHHFFGYEGRCADPTNFDADYTYALGFNAAMLINSVALPATWAPCATSQQRAKTGLQAAYLSQ